MKNALNKINPADSHKNSGIDRRGNSESWCEWSLNKGDQGMFQEAIQSPGLISHSI